MNVGAWYGGSSPHQPFQEKSLHGPRSAPNMLRPRMKAPKLSIARCPKWSSMPPVVPPSCPVIGRKLFVWKNHENISCPRLPSGASRLCSGPAPRDLPQEDAEARDGEA